MSSARCQESPQELCNYLGCFNAEGLLSAELCKFESSPYVGVLLNVGDDLPLNRTLYVQDWSLAGSCEDWTPVGISGECVSVTSFVCERFLCNGVPAALVTADYSSGSCRDHYGVFSTARFSGDCGLVPDNLIRTCPLVPK